MVHAADEAVLLDLVQAEHPNAAGGVAILALAGQEGEVTFSLPIGERHRQAVFEAVTGYMPQEFQRFIQFNPESGDLEPLSDGPGEQRLPIVFAVPGGTHAMGIYAPPQPARNRAGPTYGRFRFPVEKVVKWNCVFRTHEEDGIAPGGRDRE
jgi:hypothetical protein